MDCIDLGQHRDKWWRNVSTVMNLRVLKHVKELLRSRMTGDFSTRTQFYGVTYLV
jgi:hypothetical protein